VICSSVRYMYVG